MEKIEFEFDPTKQTAEVSHEPQSPPEHLPHHTHHGHKKKKRVSRVRFYFFNIFMAFLILCVGVGIFVWYGCTLEELTANETTYVTKIDVERELFTSEDLNNTVILWATHLFHPAKGIPFVKKVSLSIEGPHTLHMEIQEKEIIGMVMLSEEEYVYFDAEGVVQEISKNRQESVCSIEGVTLKKASVGEKLAVHKSVLKNITTLYRLLHETEYQPRQIVFDADNTFGFWYQDVFVDIGTSTNLQDKLHRLPLILEQLDGESGVLHMAEWSNENSDIIFEKD